MYDQYVANPPLPCRHCGAPLSELQGKDGPRLLLVWREGTAAPIDEMRDLQWRLAAEQRVQFRLPPLFHFYGSCERCSNWTEFTGCCVDGFWADSILGCFESLERPAPARDLGAGMRQCTKCAHPWEWQPARTLCECPECHALTRLLPSP